MDQKVGSQQKIQKELIDLKQEQINMLESQKLTVQEKEKLQLRNSLLEREKKQQIQEISQLSEQLRSKTHTQTQQTILEESIRRKTDQLQQINQQIEIQQEKQKELENKQQTEIKELNVKLQQYEQKIKDLEEKLKQKELIQQLEQKQNSSKKQESQLENIPNPPSLIPPIPPPLNLLIPQAPSLNPPPPPPPMAPSLFGVPPPPIVGAPQAPKIPQLMLQPKPQIKKLRCDPVEQIQNTIWADIEDTQPIKFEGIQEIFSNQIKKQMTKTPSQIYLEKIKSNTQNGASNNKKQSLFKPKREENLNIEFKQFLKKGNVQQLLEGFQKLDEKYFTEEDCQKLLRIVNNPDELRAFEDFQGDSTTLDDFSQFIYGLIKVENYLDRLKYFQFKKEYNQRYKETKQSLTLLQQTSNQIITSKSLKNFLQNVLRLIQDWESGAQIKGIQLQSILGFKSLKSQDLKTDALQYLVGKIHQQYPENLTFVDELLPLLNQIKNVDITDQFSQSKNFIRTFGNLAIKLNKEGSTDQDFYNFFQPFYLESHENMKELEILLNQTESLCLKCMKYFNETDKSKQNDFYKTMLEMCEKVKNEIPNKMNKTIKFN